MIRRKKVYQDHFTLIDRRALEDERLSFEARGVLAYLMAKPDHWEIRLNHLREHGGRWRGVGRKGKAARPMSRDKMSRILGELCELGYAKKLPQAKTTGSQFTACDYEVGDVPESRDEKNDTARNEFSGNGKIGTSK